MENDYLADNNQRLFDPSFPVAYNEAIPNKLGVVDLFDMDNSESNFATKWIAALFGKNKAAFPIHPSHSSKKKIEYLFFNALNRERLKGYRNIGFGFPILVKKDRNAYSGLLSAPIFIWSIQLEPNANNEAIWQIAGKIQAEVQINPILGEICPEVAELVEVFKQKIQQKGLNMTLCNDFCQSLSTLMKYENARPMFGVNRFPAIEDLVTIQKSGIINWSGVIANFPPIHFYSLTDSILSKDYWKETAETLATKNQYHFCYLPCDHQQKAAHIASVNHKFVVIEGAAGSGKNHTICNFLIANLLNSQRSLVVSMSVVELEKLRDKLVVEGFGDLVFLFKNLDLDKDNIIDSLVAKADLALKNKANDIASFPMTYLRFDKYRNQLDKSAISYSKNVFDINNWTETVGLFLKNSRSEGKELLDTQLQVNDFSFDFLEYEQIKERIEKSQKIFRDSFSFYHPLNDLEDSVFSYEDPKEAKTKLRSQLRNFLRQARKIQRKYFEEAGAYKKAQEAFYENYSQNIKSKIGDTQDAIEHLQLQFGKEYNKTSVGNLKIFKTFSGRSKTALELKSQILDQYEALKSSFSTKKYFEFEFSEMTSSGNIDIIEEQLQLFENALNGWNHQRPEIVQENIKRLNSTNIHSSLPFANRIASVEQSIEKFQEALNEAKLFKQTIKNNAMTLQLKHQLLEELVEKISISIHNLRDFDDFYDWRRLCATFSATDEKVIKALINVRPKNWSTSFDAWYFNNLLSNQSRQSADFDKLLTQYLSNYRSIKDQIPEFIDATWSKERGATLIAAKKQKRNNLSSLLKKSKTTNDFSTYFKKHLQTISHFYPILLMTTETAKELLKTDTSVKFDSLMINEGGNFTKEQGGNLLSLANRVQVFGSDTEGMVADNHSFWEMAKGLAGKHIYLKNQHRKTAIPLLIFNNAAFNQQLEVSLNGNIDYGSIELNQVDGAYEEKSRINDAECQYMLSLLNDIKRTPQKTFPKVGIACATIEQRNHFSSYLLKIKQNRSSGAEKIQHLERNGLGVYQFEELAGQQFDVLIISFTFGKINATDEITTDIDYFNAPQGKRILQTLLNSGIQQVIICNSIPTTFIRKIQKQKSKKAIYLLANFLDYADSVSNNDVKRVDEIIELLSETAADPNQILPSVFLKEVAGYLSAYFEPERVLQGVSSKKEILPLVIKGKYEQQLDYVIKVDSFFNQSDVFSYVWEEQSNKNLESSGYKILPIWSRDWWINPEQEARKLASLIIKDDAAYAAEEEIELLG